jgi:hypothetical protein
MRGWRVVPYSCVLLIAVSGCATIAHGSRQTVTVTSDVPGATVTLLTKAPEQEPVVRSTPGITPVDVRAPRREQHLVVRVEKEGCPAAEVKLTRRVSAWVAGDLIPANPLSMQGMSHPSRQYPQQVFIGVPVMFGIDLLSGGAYKLPRRVHVDLCGAR